MRRVIPGVISIICACTAHDDGPEPRPPQPEPPLLQEAEPEIPLPPVVAPALPELAPTRPLANLDVLWARTEGPLADTLWPVGTSVVAVDANQAATLGLAGPPDELTKLELDQRWQLRRAGPLTIAASDHELVAFEAGTNGVRWAAREDEATSYVQFVSPRALVAEYYAASGDFIVAWALDDGRKLWTRAGGPSAEFERIQNMWFDGTRGYFTSAAALEAFDPATGATLWTVAISNDDCGVATGEGKVVVERVGGHLVLDASTGTVLRSLAHDAPRCGWEAYDYMGVTPGVIADGKLYAFDGDPPDGGHSPLRAWDLDSGDQLWTASGFGDDALVADHDAVYVTRDDQTLVALDAGTGKPVTEISIGTWFSARVEPVGGAAGPLIVIEDDDGGAWLLGRAPDAPTLEDWEIRGRLVSDGYLDAKRLAKVRVHVGEQRVETDKRGRFVARGRGLGAVRVSSPQGEDAYAADTWTIVGIDAQRVMLDGSGRYELGDLEAYEISME